MCNTYDIGIFCQHSSATITHETVTADFGCNGARVCLCRTIGIIYDVGVNFRMILRTKRIDAFLMGFTFFLCVFTLSNDEACRFWTPD